MKNQLILTVISLFLIVCSLPYSALAEDKALEHAEFCFRDGSNSRAIDKLNRGTCSSLGTSNPALTENQLAVLAVESICRDQRDLAKSSLLACQCHNMDAQQEIIANWGKVENYLRQRGGC